MFYTRTPSGWRSKHTERSRRIGITRLCSRGYTRQLVVELRVITNLGNNSKEKYLRYLY